MSARFIEHLSQETVQLKLENLFKRERALASAQSSDVIGVAGEHFINMCANNYLGLANHPDIVAAAKITMDQYGFGLASVRFICGTQDLHLALEKRISDFVGMPDAILYSSCFDANAGLFETLLGPEDAIISDSLNHASIIDGVRLCKAKRFRYRNNDMDDLKAQLEASKDARFRLIATDGVFSMDGIIANLADICALADEYDALVMVDDSHAVGFLGESGRGSHEYCGVMDRIDILTGTFGKALGGASGGYTAARNEIVTWLRQRSRPYLFSNTLAPAMAGGTLKALDLIEQNPEPLRQLEQNSQYFREKMSALGFELAGQGHPIIPVMLGDAAKAVQLADNLLQQGIYVIAFSYPVVPKNQARIRVQLSAAHTQTQLDKAIAAFAAEGRALGVIT
jgi:glycine C-acetyltransferase